MERIQHTCRLNADGTSHCTAGVTIMASEFSPYRRGQPGATGSWTVDRWIAESTGSATAAARVLGVGGRYTAGAAYTWYI